LRTNPADSAPPQPPGEGPSAPSQAAPQATAVAPAESSGPQPTRERVVYLLGAGASHACVKAVNSAYGVLMRHLGEELASKVRDLVERQYKGKTTLHALANNVINENTDFEHVITFLDESSSSLHKMFADDLRDIFEEVLRQRLAQIEAEQGEAPVGLYTALLDMHEVPGFTEELRGFLSLNYDQYLELAIQKLGLHTVNAGVLLSPSPEAKSPIRVLKLHGSFGWDHCWPITTSGVSTLWIPPGIQKAKESYPFNLLWGLARELLDCDILRIVGCRLGPNDWDLVSLLFTTRHTNSAGRPYRIEVIDSPDLAAQLQKTFPYLDVLSLLEIGRVGKQLVSEVIGGDPREFRTLSLEDQKKAIETAGTGRNWLRLWLKQMAETLYAELGSIETASGVFKHLLEADD
jgi:hypothetical protein